jgi:hypothetical protein
MKKSPLLLIILFYFISHNIYSQLASEYIADKNQDSYVNVDVLKTYGRVSDKGYKSIDMLKKLANASFFNSNFIEAAKWYDQLFSMTSDIETVYYYRYAQSLKSVNNLKKADEMMKIFIEKSK